MSSLTHCLARTPNIVIYKIIIIIVESLFWPLFNTTSQDQKGRLCLYLILGWILRTNLGCPPWNCADWAVSCFQLIVKFAKERTQSQGDNSSVITESEGREIPMSRNTYLILFNCRSLKFQKNTFWYLIWTHFSTYIVIWNPALIGSHKKGDDQGDMYQLASVVWKMWMCWHDDPQCEVRSAVELLHEVLFREAGLMQITLLVKCHSVY